MSQTLAEIAQKLRNNDKKVQVIFAFNGTGKTRLSREFKQLIEGNENEGGSGEQSRKFLYYSALTEDLFSWDNLDANGPKLQIQPNDFTNWVLDEQGLDRQVISNFQHYTSEKLNPSFNGKFSEATFSIEKGDESSGNIKISKGEESMFVWSVFYTLLDEVIQTLNIPEPEDRSTDQFNGLEYVFIDDPVSSLDENHLIELAANLAALIRGSESNVRFVLTTHNPIFYNVLHNSFKTSRGDGNKFILKKTEAGFYELNRQNDAAPFGYHLFLKHELERAIKTGEIKKYHFNFLRNLLEKTAIFLGHDKWAELLPNDGSTELYAARMINLMSHSSSSADEAAELSPDDKRVLTYLVGKFNQDYPFKKEQVDGKTLVES